MTTGSETQLLAISSSLNYSQFFGKYYFWRTFKPLPMYCMERPYDAVSIFCRLSLSLHQLSALDHSIHTKAIEVDSGRQVGH